MRRTRARSAGVAAVVALAAVAAGAGAESPPVPCLVFTPPPPPVSREASRFGLAGMRSVDRQTRMSEAGVTWSLNPRVKLRLSYERTAFAPLMPHDHDDGILTGIRFGF